MLVYTNGASYCPWLAVNGQTAPERAVVATVRRSSYVKHTGLNPSSPPCDSSPLPGKEVQSKMYA